MKIALGVSGGIACYKAAEILRRLQDRGFDVVVAMTKVPPSLSRPLTFRALSGHKVYIDMFESPPREAISTAHSTTFFLLSLSICFSSLRQLPIASQSLPAVSQAIS
jgi:phosphopantothenoylcysteine decarboxylase/phosphopantothenate--cysteine ligase